MPPLIHLIQNGTLRMIQEIWHVSSRCGGGKSRETIKELVQHLASQQPVAETYLFASSSLPLSDQNYRFTLDEASQYPQCNIPVQKVDINEAVGSVVGDIKQRLQGGFKGVMFISHKALSLLPAQALRNVRVVIDEVPQDLAGTLMVTHDPKSQNTAWEQYLQASYTSSGDEVVTLVPGMRSEVEGRIRDIRSSFDRTLSSSVADLLEHLLIGNEPIYRGKTTMKGRSCRIYQAVHYHHLKKLVENVSYLAILSAQLKETLFGFICEDLLGLPIVEKPINDSTNLEKKHRNQTIIIPVLCGEGEWSSALRTKPANESLVNQNGQFVPSSLPVGEFAQVFAENILGRRDFMITLHTKEEMLQSLKDRGIIRTTTKVQGRNDLRYLDHAVYLASTNLTPFDGRIYRQFAADRNLSVKKLLKAIKVERSYETAYQCVARTSIRNPPVYGKQHTIIVPDMKHAEYIEGWFEDRCAIIYTDPSYITKNEYNQQSGEQGKFAEVVDILEKEKKNLGTREELIKASSLKRSAFYRFKSKFKNELIDMGLLQPKPKR